MLRSDEKDGARPVGSAAPRPDTASSAAYRAAAERLIGVLGQSFLSVACAGSFAHYKRGQKAPAFKREMNGLTRFLFLAVVREELPVQSHFVRPQVLRTFRAEAVQVGPGRPVRCSRSGLPHA